MNEHAGKTAIRRNKMSAPTKWLLKNGDLGREDYWDSFAVLDYGAGKGDDVRELGKLGFNITGYDPNHEPFKQDPPHFNYDIVLCNYVLNVTRDDDEMKEIMMLAYSRVRQGGKVFFSVRRDIKKEGKQRTGAYQRNVWPDNITKECKLIHTGNGFDIYCMYRKHV